MKRLLKYLLIHPLAFVLLLLLALLVGGALFALTDGGTRILASNAERFVPNLKLEQLEGALISGIKLQKLSWHDDSTQIEMDQLASVHEIDIALPATLQFTTLSADKLVIRLNKQTDEKTTATQDDEIPTIVLPLNLNVKKLAVKKLEIWSEGKPLRFNNVLLSAYTHDGKLQVDNLQAQYADESGTIDFAVQGNMALAKPHAIQAQVQFDAKHKAWGMGKGNVNAQGELQQSALKLFGDWQSIANGQAHIQGDISWKKGFSWNADLTGKGINPEFYVKEFPAKVDVALTSQGSVINGKPQIALDVRKLQGKVRDYPIDAKAQGEWNGKLITVQALDALVGKNHLQATGKADEKLAVEWKIDAPDLAQLYPKIHGNAKGSGVLRGLADASQLQLEVADLAGKVEGYDLKAAGKLDWGQQKLAAQNVVIQSGNNRLDVSGQATEPFDLKWKVDAKNLANAWKGLEGSLQGEGMLKGRLDQPEIQANLTGNKLRFQNYRVGALDLQVKQTGERYDLQGTLQALVSGDTQVKSAKFAGQGSITNHHLSAQISHDAGKVDFAANGGWQNGQWHGTVQNLALRDTAAGNWDTAGAVTLTASDAAFNSTLICLVNRGSRACGKPTWSKQAGFSITGELQQIPLVMLRQWLPDTVSPSGAINADYHFEQRGGRPIANVGIRLPDSNVTVRGDNGKAETLQYSNARADINLNDRHATVQAQADLNTYGQVRADGTVDLSPQDGKHRLNMHLTAAMPSIAWMERFSHQVENLQGKLDADLQITGLLSNPQVAGEARLSNAQVHLPEAGVNLEAINLTMQANGANHALITGSLRAGQGILNATGNLSLANLPNWQADVSLKGNNLKLMDSHEAQIWVSPDLQLQVSPTRVAITGDVLIPETNISLREIPQGASVRSDDVIIVGRRAPAKAQLSTPIKESPLDIQPDVTIALGEKVKFVGFGLDARLEGKFHVSRTRQDIVAEGVLNVLEGVYKAYGQSLSIERGRLLFNGPLDNPGLDVRAIREVDNGDIKVGIALAGSLKKPESTLFSTPQQTQSDTLSYLLTGRAMSGLSGDQSSLLVDAVTQLGVAGGDGLVQQLGGGLGLDELGVHSKNGNFEQSELALGKRLGPRLYVRYIVSLFDSLQRLALTYQVNKHLQLEAQTGLYQGLDLIYKIDTNKGPLGP